MTKNNWQKKFDKRFVGYPGEIDDVVPFIAQVRNDTIAECMAEVEGMKSERESGYLHKQDIKAKLEVLKGGK